MVRQELEERIREAKRIPGFREFLEQQTYSRPPSAYPRCAPEWAWEQRNVVHIDVDARRGVVGCLFRQDEWGPHYNCRYVDIGAFRRGRGAVAGEILVRARPSLRPDFNDFTRYYDRVEIAEITDDRVRVRAIAEREGGRSDEFEFRI